MRGPRIIGIGCVVWALGLIVGIVASSVEMSLGAGLRAIASTRWGVTTLVDLYAGLVVVGIWIACIERRPARAGAWFLALMLTGNLATLVYIALRAFRARSVREIFIPPTPS